MESDGESFALLGGDRIPSAATQGSSFTITQTSTVFITVQGHYPMQRSTSPQVYLRCGLPSNNIESSSLSGGQFDNHTLTSNILGVFQSDHEFVHYDSISQRAGRRFPFAQERLPLKTSSKQLGRA